MDSARGALHVQEFFFSRSFVSNDSYFMQHKAFSKEWMDMKAFLEKVCIFPLQVECYIREMLKFCNEYHF